MGSEADAEGNKQLKQQQKRKVSRKKEMVRMAMHD